MGMKDPEVGRLKAFFFVGIAYFVIAVIVPAILIKAKGAAFSFPTAGWTWSLIVNALVSMSMHPPKGGLSGIPIPFMVGIVLAAVGGCLVALFKPAPAPAAPPTEQAIVQTHR